MEYRASSVQRATLSREECLRRLENTDLARVVISVRCLPAALPARISVVNDEFVLLASAEESVVTAARRGDVLSIQIDGLEADGSTWSVMASGLAKPAEEGQNLSEVLHKAVARGAALISLPLSVVVGERIG